ncbi:hypothetical protein TWF569_008768 [Orbilia oligospora]|uniref:F-box domain-containing protein n=1 Tax=Orbilia oligospora TaxID=2813651 RepID=A0A7C8K3H4_ORBOL|nr:hypothetical protein TWF706_007505 [Orbilia oligospora]KAF3098827.1 hypothetical protein TWF103_008977 [Orbilia oligospora]KAF3107986.1 hypothetical protein TWF102_011472 [Orbilia oligospora]KAF3135781.1 hypothetical protein TWF703_005876 [Orbilia oligospora]KAF3138268.1 hypothetical protein TWF569_008768 [Orbilia oligospora]
MGSFTLDHLPSEIILQCCKYFDDYTVLSTLRPVCRSWCYATEIKIPSGTMAGLPPAIWEKILSYNMDYKTMHAVSQTCSSLRSLTKTSRISRLQGSAYRLPAMTPLRPGMASKIVQHPAFENICCRIETGSLIYHKSGNCCPNNVLTFPVAEENATNPPVSKILVKFSSKYGVSLRPVLIDRPRLENEGGVTVGDVYKAMQRLFAEPLSQKQIVAIKRIRDWEARKHEAAKQSLARIEQLGVGAATTPSTPASGSSPERTPEKEPVIEHDDAIIYLGYPFDADALPHTHNTVRRQREFLHDFPYVYASVHVTNVINEVQVFNLTYH